MLTVKELRDIIINNFKPEDIIEIIPNSDSVTILDYVISANKETYIKKVELPSTTVKEYAYQIYKALTEYNDDSEAVIYYTDKLLYISDVLTQGGTLWKHKHPLNFKLPKNDWEYVSETLKNI